MAIRDDYAPRLNITIWSLTGVATVFLAARIYCKVWRKRPVRADDYVLIASWSALVTSCSLLSAITMRGYGRHSTDIAQQNFDYILLVSYTGGFFSILAACWSKISFAITLLYVVTNRRVKLFLWFMLVSVNLVLGANATIQYAQCWPPQHLWHPGSEGHCWPRAVVIHYNIFAAAYSGFADIVLALLPWMIVWSSSITLKEKLGALFAMSMGVFAGITSLLKISTLAAIASQDIADSINLLIFGEAESAISIIAVSIPILRGLLYNGNHPPMPRFYHQPYDRVSSVGTLTTQSAAPKLSLHLKDYDAKLSLAAGDNK